MRAPQFKTWYVTLVPKSGNGLTVSWSGEARSKQAAIKEVWSRHPDKKSTHKIGRVDHG
jgi:hypothetical protein